MGPVGTNWPVFSGEVLIGGIGTYLNLSHLWLEGVVFDSHSSPPYLLIYQYVTATRGNIKGEACGFLAHKQAPSVRSVQLGYTENQSKSHKFV